MYICTLFSSNSKHEAPLASRAVSTSRYSKHFFYRTQRLHPKQPEHLCLGNWLGKRFCFSSTTVCMQACVDLAHLMLRLFLNGLLLAAVHYLFMAPTHTLEHAAEKKPRKVEKKGGGGSIIKPLRCTLAGKRAHITRTMHDGGDFRRGRAVQYLWCGAV